MLHLLREAWRRGEPGVAQEDMLRRERNRLGLDDGHFAALDLVARGELGLLASAGGTDVGFAVGVDGPARRGVPFVVVVQVSNRSARDFRTVRVRVESPYLHRHAGLEPFPLPAGGTAEARGEFLADDAFPEGAPVRLGVQVEDRHGTIRVYRPEDRIRIPVAESAGGRTGPAIRMYSAAGGLARADLGHLPEETISDLRRSAARGLPVRVNLAALAGMRGGREGVAGLVPVTVRLDRERSTRLAPLWTLPMPSALAAPVERALFRIEENARARRVHLLPKGTTVFGRPLGPADMWLGVWNEAGEPDPDRTGKISARHFAIRYDGLFYIRDLGSANGVRVNNEVLGEAWRPLSHRDRIIVARGALVLTALLDMTSGAAMSVGRICAWSGKRTRSRNTSSCPAASTSAPPPTARSGSRPPPN
ncbi:MAG: FHA domain-containing protein [Planctomycetaceae bacterium]|nr:FHA domain-containing protein [Planctomycetaceae bacterium]